MSLLPQLVSHVPAIRRELTSGKRSVRPEQVESPSGYSIPWLLDDLCLAPRDLVATYLVEVVDGAETNAAACRVIERLILCDGRLRFNLTIERVPSLSFVL